MSRDEKKPGRRPLKNGPPDRFQPKVALIWLVVLLAIISVMVFSPMVKPEPTILSIHQLKKQVELGNVLGGTIKSDLNGGPEWYLITGTLRMEPAQAIAFGASDNEGETASSEDGTDEAVPQKPSMEQIASGIPFQAEGRLTETVFANLQETGLFHEQKGTNVWSDLLVSLVPFLIIIGLLYFLFVRQLRSAGRGAMSFGKSRAKLLTRDRERITFKAVAGCDEAKEEVSEVIDFLRDPKKFQRIGGKIPKGILMVGPPGTGKTLLARAVAGEADVPFFTISGSDFVEMFVGVGASRVRDMFEQARKHAPCIVFVDEIDAVGRQRGAGLGGGNDEREQTLNSLLVEMDGFDGHEGVVIIAATNRPDVLDNALLRPGRFDRQVTIDLPDINGREEILQVHAKKIKMGADVDLQVVARSTPGFSGADLANLLNEGALIAARYDKTEVTRHDIEEARDKISFGRERRRLMDEEDRRATAFHEAGHALVQAVLKDKKLALHKVTIIPRGRALGLTMSTPTKDILGQSKKELLDRVCVMMAGRVGEEMETGDFSNGASSDIKQATTIARHMVCDWGMSDIGPVALGDNQEQLFLAREITRSQNYSEETARKIDAEIQTLIKEQFKRAERIVAEHRDALTKISEALLEFETIDAIHVNEIIEHGELKSPVQNNEALKRQWEKDKKEADAEKREEAQEDECEDKDTPPSSDTAGATA